MPTREPRGAKRQRRLAHRLRDRRLRHAVAVLGLLVSALAAALLVGVGSAVIEQAARPLQRAAAPLFDRGCGPAELRSLDNWTLARVERTPASTPRKRLWERTLGRETQAALQARLGGWPQRLVVDAAELPHDRRAFADRVARDTWRGLDALTDRSNGLPLDTITFAPAGGGPPAALRIGDYTNVTNVGLQLVNIVGALELGLLREEEARGRVLRILDTLAGLETDAGFFFNYYDTTSLERTSHFISFVDSAWLAAGLMVVRMTFPEFYERCSLLLDDGDFGVFYDAGPRLLSHGYYVDPRAASRYHYGVLYTEARLGALLAIGKGDVPDAVWFAMQRTFPADCRWQSRTPQDVRTVELHGHEVTAGTYRWGGLRYVPSWGGSMFEALMPTLVLDEQRAAPRSLGRNGLAHVVGQRRFARRELGLPVWGLSPSARPGSDSYGEYGARPLGSLGYPPGPITPHAAALAVTVLPRAALDNLYALATRYAAYGDFGFYDAVDPASGEVAYKYLALDQSMLFIALVNYLTDGAVQRRFADDPIMRRALPLIAAEDFFS